MASNGMSSILSKASSLRPLYTIRLPPLCLPLHWGKAPSASTITHPNPQRNTHTISNSTDDAYQAALTSNKTWREQISQSDPNLFPTLAKGQSPQILWLGCSDSRCPETTLLGLKPGDVFVHRNIANIFTPTDLSSAAVLAFAVGALKVKHIVVAGHTSCGGVAAALGADSKGGVLDAWLAPLRRVRADLTPGWEKDGIAQEERNRQVTEGNVRAGVRTVRENGIVAAAVKEGSVKVHGVIYDVGSGEVRELGIEEGEEEKGRREGVFALN